MEYTKGKWRAKTGQFQSGASYYLNRIRVAGYEWNAMRSQSERHNNNDWLGTVTLPSLMNNTVVAGKEREIKGKIEHMVSSWFKQALAKTEVNNG